MDRNPVVEQDRAADLFYTWNKYGYAMFPQQRAIYANLGPRLDCKSVLEAGCGSGLGSAMLERWSHGGFCATDRLERNVRFAAQLYPWVAFKTWNVEQSWRGDRADVVVAIEMLEHLERPELAIANLLAAAYKEVWISTPNGRGKPSPPTNPCHVYEYTTNDMLNMIGSRFEILHWQTFEELDFDTDVDPLVYRIIL